MVRAWCEVWKGFDQTQLNAWFGNSDQSGSLIFFDAIPIHPVQLKADIMTPHYNQWYAKGDEASINDGSNVPADWHDPIPVPFLTVDKGQSFQFGIAKRPGFEGDISDVLIDLQEALQWLGAGAKTAAGYGRFSEDIAAKLEREKKSKEHEIQRLADAKKSECIQQAIDSGLSGLAFKLDVHARQSAWETDKGAFMKDATQWLGEIQSANNSEEQQQAAELMAEYLEHHDKGIMQNPDKKKGKKMNKSVYKPNSISLAKALKIILPNR
ncbi:MAG: type III-B CRISPR module RAMP protein Cmr6 [Ghiorsea sp.]|nr:type III-B CRISPR module RAMP protein Cmr6 [Ghiorsea sp.]